MAKTYKREELAEAFTMNCSSDNTIQPSKLGVVIRSVGLAPSESQIKALTREFESKSVRALNLQQVEAICDKYGFEREHADELRDAFRIFDKEGNGLVSASELRYILCNLGEKLTDEEVDEMIREADITGDGQISVDEFVRVLEGI